MNDHYNLEKLDSIDKHKLIEHYKESKASEAGSIQVWGDCIGRPGDNIYRLNQIRECDDSLTFEFGNGEIICKNPDKVYINELIIAIKRCDEIIWIDRSVGLKTKYRYDPSSKSLITEVIEGILTSSSVPNTL